MGVLVLVACRANVWLSWADVARPEHQLVLSASRSTCTRRRQPGLATVFDCESIHDRDGTACLFVRCLSGLVRHCRVQTYSDVPCDTDLCDTTNKPSFLQEVQTLYIYLFFRLLN